MLKITVFWDVTPCILVDEYLCFGGTFRLRLQSPLPCYILDVLEPSVGPHVVATRMTVGFVVVAVRTTILACRDVIIPFKSP
jgi:hypothetical protein